MDRLVGRLIMWWWRLAYRKGWTQIKFVWSDGKGGYK